MFLRAVTPEEEAERIARSVIANSDSELITIDHAMKLHELQQRRQEEDKRRSFESDLERGLNRDRETFNRFFGTQADAQKLRDFISEQEQKNKRMNQAIITHTDNNDLVPTPGLDFEDPHDNIPHYAA